MAAYFSDVFRFGGKCRRYFRGRRIKKKEERSKGRDYESLQQSGRASKRVDDEEEAGSDLNSFEMNCSITMATLC